MMKCVRRYVIAAAIAAGAAALPGLVVAQDAAPAAASATQEPSPVVPAAAAPTHAGPIGPAPKDKAQVIFFRPSSMGLLVSFSVHDGLKGVGKLGVQSYFIDLAQPGSHTYSIQSESKNELTLEVDAGETYYVKQTLGIGIVMGRPKLVPSDEAEFQKSHLKLSTKKATDLKPGA